MTSRELLRVALRRWYLIVLGVLLTLGALYPATHQPGVYFTDYVVVMLPPSSDLRPNTIEDPRYQLTPMAGVIVTQYNDGKRGLLLGSADTTLYGEGLRSGSRVRLPNHGSQWQPLYTTPNIGVQVVGPTQAKVNSRAKRINLELARLVKQRQDELGIQDSVRVSTLVSPRDPVIQHIGGSNSRVAVGLGTAGATITTIATVQFDRWRQRRRLRAGAVITSRV